MAGSILPGFQHDKDKKQFLGEPKTMGYRPQAYWAGFLAMRREPPFSWRCILEMLADARVKLGLALVKGPILSKCRFFIDCDDTEVKEFLKEQVTRFWRMSASKALKAIEWGFSCSEVLYRVQEGMIHFDSLKDLHAMDCRAVSKKGRLSGAVIHNVPYEGGKRNVTLNGPRAFWCIHNREIHPWYGRSKLYGAYWSWLELWCDGGARDSRRLFFHKYAFAGETGYAPGTMFKDLDSGQEQPAIRFMQQILEQKKNGATCVFPNTRDQNGNRLWEVEPAKSMGPADHLMEYIHDLRTEILEGMEIPPEVVQTDGTGAYGGRAIPMEAFYSTLQEIVNWLAHDLQSQILEPLVAVNFGKKVPFQLIPFGLAFASSTPEDQRQAAGNQQGQQPTNQSNGDSTVPAGSYAMSLVDPVVDDPPRGYRPRYSKVITVAFSNLTIDPDEADIDKVAERAGICIVGLDRIQLRMGLQVEQEHDGVWGDDTKLAYTMADAMKIVVAHLREDSLYYTHLREMEAKARGEDKAKLDSTFAKLAEVLK